MKVLVIDDSRAMRRILSRFLGELGFEITEAANGKEGLAALTASTGFDVILVDWNMPVMNGVEFIRAAREDRRFDSMPIMMVTSESELDRVAEALESGANEYVMKPFTSEMISEKLAILGLPTDPVA